MFLGCLYLGPLLFPLLSKAEIVTCFLFNGFAVKLRSLLFHSSVREISCAQILQNCSGEAQQLWFDNQGWIQPKNSWTSTAVEYTACTVSSILWLRSPWPICFVNIYHICVCNFFTRSGIYCYFYSFLVHFMCLLYYLSLIIRIKTLIMIIYACATHTLHNTYIIQGSRSLIQIKLLIK